jgi:hypothetical protein
VIETLHARHSKDSNSGNPPIFGIERTSRMVAPQLGQHGTGRYSCCIRAPNSYGFPVATGAIHSGRIWAILTSVPKHGLKFSSETYHDEARKIFDRGHLRADQTSRDAQTGHNHKRLRKASWKSDSMVRRDGDRLVLVHVLHRLEACWALGEETIHGYLVQAQMH